jgi:UDP-glucose 6-dehydrogenase
MANIKQKIGFLGIGWIGKNYADNFEARGYHVVRYSREKQYIKNKAKLKQCNIVFVAVPTPTTPQGFDDSILINVLPILKAGTSVIIKSTVLPGTIGKLQRLFPKLFIFHSPEFLTEATAAYDAGNPTRNIIGMAKINNEFKVRADQIMKLLPFAPYNLVCTAEEAAYIKYGGNCWFYFKVVFINMLYDLVKTNKDCRWEVIRDAMAADNRIGRSHLDPIHKSGRGAGGHCFIKDFEAFKRMYDQLVDDNAGDELLYFMVKRNLKYLRESGKDLDLVEGVYGKS